MPLRRPKRTDPSTNDFREVQHFNQWWLWAILVGLAFTGWWAFIEQIVLGKPWGNIPASDATVIVMWLAMGVGMPIAMRRIRMVVRVTDESLHVRYVPLRHRVIPLSTITSATPRRYRPLRDFMGWGIRWMPGRGWVYSMSGDQGVQLVLGKRRKLLIGSRNPEALAAAIHAAQSPSDHGPGGGTEDGEGRGGDWDERWGETNEDYGQRANAFTEEPMVETTSENEQVDAANGFVSSDKKGNGVVRRLATGLNAAKGRALTAGRTIRGKSARVIARVPTLGTLVRRLQDLALRFGTSERVQRMADNPKEHAAEAGRRARVHANRATVHVKEHAVRAKDHAVGAKGQAEHLKQHAVRAKKHAVRAKENAGQQLREARLPDRVAEPARRYLRNPQLIVDDLKRTG